MMLSHFLLDCIYVIISSKKKLDVFLKYFLLSIIFIGLYSETIREIYPYHKGYIIELCKGAFTK